MRKKEANHLPLSNITDDELGFNDKAEEIANFINKISADLPYSISTN